MPIYTGTTGNDTLTGSGGDDEIYGNGGADTIDAGDGNDLVVLRAQVNAPTNSFGIINGGAGLDTLRIDPMYTPVNAQGSGGAYAFSTAILFQTATTVISGFERLAFNSQAGGVLNVSLQFGGAAGQTNQIGSGLTADATLIGGAGLDILTLSYNASVAGGIVTMPSFTYSNWDTVTRAYLAGDRVQIGITGANGVTLNGSAHLGVQGLIGGAGSDTINGSNDMDLISGGSGGSDLLYGNGGDDTLQVVNTYIFSGGSPGPESTRTGANTLFDGGSGFDFLQFGGNVNFQGSLANIEGIYLTPGYLNLNNTGAPVGFGSQYSTVASLSRTTLATLPANLTIAGQGTLVVNFSDTGQELDGSGYIIEGDEITFSFVGGTGNDTITGTSGGDTLNGKDGFDTLSGGDGDDVFYLDGDADVANGDAGDDVFNLTGGTNASTINGGVGAFDTVWVNSNNTFTGTLSGIEVILLDAGSQLVIGANTLTANFPAGGYIGANGSGTSLVVVLCPADYEFAGSGLTFGGSQMLLVVIGNAQDDAIKGNPATFNYIDGGSGSDQLRGGALSDTILGGEGNDKIIGANGKDTLTGGAGADTFRFNLATNSGTGTSADVITDFVSGTDRLGFGNLDADLVAPGRQALSYIGNAALGATGAAQVRWGDSGSDLRVQIDLDGNGTSDMEVVLQGLAGQSLTSGDFLL